VAAANVGVANCGVMHSGTAAMHETEQRHREESKRSNKQQQ
jgi:hypothetical protein